MAESVIDALPDEGLAAATLPRATLAFLVVSCSVSYALIAVALGTDAHPSYPVLHDVLDAGCAFVAAMIALTLWTRVRATENRLPDFLAACFAVLAVFELIHLLVASDRIEAMIKDFRPGTWPPSAYLLPLSLLWALHLGKTGSTMTRRRMAGFLFAAGLVLLVLFEVLPRYTAPTVFGMTRPLLLGAPVLWFVLAVVAWRAPAQIRLGQGISLLALFLGIANIVILFSTGAHDDWAMQAHIGKLIGYLQLQVFIAMVGGLDGENLLHTARALRESEERFRLAVAKVQDFAVFILDPDGRISTWNAGAEQLTGYGAGEAVGRDLGMFHSPDDRLQRVPERALEEAASTGRNEGEGWRIRKDGTRFWAHMVVSALRDSAGKLQGYSKVITDLTQQRASAAQLEQSRLRFEDVVGSAMDAIISVGASQKIMLFNRAAADMFLLPADRAIGRPLESLIPERFQAQYRHYISRFSQDGTPGRGGGSQGTLAGVRSTGEEFPVEASISHMTVDGEGVYTIILRDITERKRAEETMANYRAQLEAVFESIQDGIVVTDMTGQFLLLNQAQAHINGYESMEAMKRDLAYFATVYELADSDGRPLPVEEWPLSRILRGETISNWEIRGRRRDTDQRWYFSFSGAPVFGEDGRQLLCIVVTRDITEKKKSEGAILELNAELERRVEERTAQLTVANKELETFSYSVSHDLRAPLRAITGFAGIVLEDYAQVLDAEGQRLLGVIQANSLRMGHLIDDLLAFSRFSRTELERVPVDMTALAHAVVEDLLQQTPSDTVNVVVAPLARVQGDYSLLQQVWVNLIGNSLKYSRTRPSPQIEVGGRLSDEVPGEYVYHVRDNGVGFDMQYADKLFGVFQRLHHAHEFEGTGVGLAIVQRIIRRHGGRIWADSSPGQGATFYFTLPDQAA